MARDYRYRETISKLQVSHNDWLSELPIKDMAEFGWLNAAPSEMVGACLRFFGVPASSRERSSRRTAGTPKNRKQAPTISDGAALSQPEFGHVL